MSIRHDWNEESAEKFDAALEKDRLEETYRRQNLKKYLKERKGVELSDIESSGEYLWDALGKYMKEKEQLSAIRGKEHLSSIDRITERSLAGEYGSVLRWNMPTEQTSDDTWMDKVDKLLKDSFDRYKPDDSNKEPEYTDENGKLTLAGLEKVMGKPVEELLEDPANRKAISEILSDGALDDALKKILGMPDSVEFTPSMRETAKRMVKEYGRMSTPDETEERWEKLNKKEQEIIRQRQEAELAKSLRKTAVSSKLSEIRDRLKDIDDIKKFSQNRIDMIAGAVYVDYDMIQKEQKETAKSVAYIKSEILDEYEKINPEMAALRKEEQKKVKEGMAPEQAQKERRAAVKAYYNKKSNIEK